MYPLYLTIELPESKVLNQIMNIAYYYKTSTYIKYIVTYIKYIQVLLVCKFTYNVLSIILRC